MKALTLNIHLIEPVLVNQLGGGDPNSAIGFNFIPGSTIRGAIIGKYLKGNQIDANDTDFQRLFLNGSVRYLNAYPQTGINKRTLPTPVSWHKDKDDEKTIIDFALKDADVKKTWKGVTEPFCFSQEDENYQTWLYDPDTQIKIHTARADRQKVTEGESTIFRYESLDSGQFFFGAILADNESDFDILKTLLDDDSSLNIGKSHLSGYGKVKIKSEIMEWNEYQQVGGDAENLLIVTLLSDTIIRDGTTGTCIANIDPVIESLHIKSKKTFVRTRIMGGFNRTWNLPIPQVLAIQAGSVFVYDNDTKLRNYLSQIEPIGIGERRAEGFGRFALDWNQMDEIEIQEHVSTPHLPVILSKESKIFAGQMVNRMMRAKLEQAVIKRINNLSLKNQIPRKSQLNSMRMIARRALHHKNANDIINYLNGMKKTASSQFQGVTIEGKPLSEWLIKIVQQDILFTLNINRDQLPYINDVKPEPSLEINLEYAVRLIDGVLNKALKEADNE